MCIYKDLFFDWSAGAERAIAPGSARGARLGNHLPDAAPPPRALAPPRVPRLRLSPLQVLLTFCTFLERLSTPEGNSQPSSNCPNSQAPRRLIHTQNRYPGCSGSSGLARPGGATGDAPCTVHINVKQVLERSLERSGRF